MKLSFGGVVGIMSLLAVTPSLWAVPYAAFDIGPSGQRVESGFVGLLGAPLDGVNGTAYAATGYTSLTGDAFTLAFTSVDWRDRGNSTSVQPLVQVAEDFVKNNAGNITFTLASLPAGTYSVTSYHKDPGFSQSARIQVFVSDSLGSERLAPTRGNAGVNTALNSLTTASLTSTATTFDFVSDGINPVAIRYNGSNSDTETPVNSLSLNHNPISLLTLTNYASIDIGPSGQRIEAGFSGIPGTPAAGANGMNLAATSLTALTGDTFTLAINNLDQTNTAVGGIDWRDRGDSTSVQSLVQMGEDFVKNNGGVVRVTLGSLPEGTYLFDSFHLDSDNTQSNNIEVLVTDALGTNLPAALFGSANPVPGNVNGLTTDFLLTSGAGFTAVSNGIDPIVLIFDGRLSADDETPLNGLRISLLQSTFVPEPGSLVMWAALGLVAGVAGWRIRRRGR